MLTGHPEIVDAISELDIGASYWQLESELFNGPTTDDEAKQVLNTKH